MNDINALRRVLEYVSVKELPKDQQKDWPPEIERREQPRFEYSAEGTGTVVHRDGDELIDVEPGFPLLTLSLSRGGAGFLCNHGLQSGDVVELSLPATGGGTKTLVVRVVRSRRAGLNAYEIGAEFDNAGNGRDA